MRQYERVEDRWPGRPRERSSDWRDDEGRRWLRVGRGDALQFMVQAVFRPGGNLRAPEAPTNITGWTLYFTAKWQTADSDAASVCQITTAPYSLPQGGSITLTAPLQGWARILMPGAATLGFPDSEVEIEWDSRGVDGAGNTWTIDHGRIVVEPRSTSFGPNPLAPTGLPAPQPSLETVYGTESATVTNGQIVNCDPGHLRAGGTTPGGGCTVSFQVQQANDEIEVDDMGSSASPTNPINLLPVGPLGILIEDPRNPNTYSAGPVQMVQPGSAVVLRYDPVRNRIKIVGGQ